VLVSVTSLGSLWRHRFGKDPTDPRRFIRGVYYNTTGVHVAGIIRQRPKVVGYARFHQCGGFDLHHPSRMEGQVFDCAEPCVWEGANKLLFQHVLHKPDLPQRFLVVTRTEFTGRLQIGAAGWRSPDTWLISFSECRQDQEAMFLMSAESWITTDLGRFVLTPDRDRPWLASLVLTTTRTGVTACGI
jgi:hypothetical protein